MIYRQTQHPWKSGLPTPIKTVWTADHFPMIKSPMGHRVDINDHRDAFEPSPGILIAKGYSLSLERKLRKRGYTPHEGYYAISAKQAKKLGVIVSIGTSKASVGKLLTNTCEMFGCRPYSMKSSDNSVRLARFAYYMLAYSATDATHAEVSSLVNRSAEAARIGIGSCKKEYKKSISNDTSYHKDAEDLFMMHGIDVVNIVFNNDKEASEYGKKINRRFKVWN